MNNNFKYDSFYYSIDNRDEKPLDEVVDSSDREYAEKYRNNIFCPFCHSVSLSLVRSKSSFLREFPNQEHSVIDGQQCPYSLEVAKPKQTNDYINSLPVKDVNRKLDATLRWLFLKDIKPAKKSPAITSSKPKLENTLLTFTTPNTNRHLQTPKYSLLHWGKNTPVNTPLITYGKVYLQIISRKQKLPDGSEHAIYFLDVRKDTHSKSITSIYFKNDPQFQDGIYYVVAYCECRPRQENNRTYYNLYLVNPSYLKFTKVY